MRGIDEEVSENDEKPAKGETTDEVSTQGPLCQPTLLYVLVSLKIMRSSYVDTRAESFKSILRLRTCYKLPSTGFLSP